MPSAIVSFLAGALCASGIAVVIGRRLVARVRRDVEDELRELEEALARDAVLARRPALLARIRACARRASDDARSLAPLFGALCEGLGARRAWLLEACCARETTSAWQFDAREPREVHPVALPTSGIEPLARLALESDGAVHIGALVRMPVETDPLAELRRRIREGGSTDAIVAVIAAPSSKPWLLGAEFGAPEDRWGAEEMEILLEVAEIIAGEIERAMLREAVGILRHQVRAHSEASPAGCTNLNAIAERVAEVLRHAPASPVRVDLQLLPSLPALAADPVDMEHLLFNACLNARASTSAGGEIRIETILVEQDELGAPGRFVELRVSDDGRGAPGRPDPRAGSRLGFWTPEEIAARLGGRAEWMRGPGDRTTLRVRFPIVERAPAAQLV